MTDGRITLNGLSQPWTVKAEDFSGLIFGGKVAIMKVKKYGHQGRPHDRLLCFDYEHKCLFWVKSEDNRSCLTIKETKNICTMSKSMNSLASVDSDDAVSKKEVGNYMMIRDIIDIVKGKKTKLFFTFFGRRADSKNCVSIIGLHRTLDLEAKDEKTANHLSEQVQDFYHQCWGFKLVRSVSKKTLEYDSQVFVRLSESVLEKVISMYRDVTTKWHEYMWNDAANKIVKDYPRLAKNIRVWDVVESKEAYRIDGERKSGWGNNIVQVMEALASQLVEAKRAKEIVDALRTAVKEVEQGKDREQTLTRFFNETFTQEGYLPKNIAPANKSMSNLKDKSVVRDIQRRCRSFQGRESFRTYYKNPQFLSILKVCNQFVLIPAADIVKREILGEKYPTRDFKPRGWDIDIEFHKEFIYVHQLKRDVEATDQLFNFQYRLSFKFKRPAKELDNIVLHIDEINFDDSKCTQDVKHEVHNRLMTVNRVRMKLESSGPGLSVPR